MSNDKKGQKEIHHRKTTVMIFRKILVFICSVPFSAGNIQVLYYCTDNREMEGWGEKNKVSLQTHKRGRLVSWSVTKLIPLPSEGKSRTAAWRNNPLLPPWASAPSLTYQCLLIDFRVCGHSSLL